jgi:hypothetical protein
VPGPGTGSSARPLWAFGLAGALPQVLLSAVIAGQTVRLSGDGGGTRPGHAMLTAAVLLFWSLVACGVLGRFRRTRRGAFAAMCGSLAGFALTLTVVLTA